MKYLQGKFITGSATLIVRGNKPELLLQQLVNSGIHMWDIKKVNSQSCHAKIRRYDIKSIQTMTKELPYEIIFENYRGLPKLFHILQQKSDIIVACLISFIFFISLSQFIWSVEINGVPEELEVKIKDHLQSTGIKKGVFKPLLANPSTIQQNLLLNVPELLWVGVELKGTKLKFSGIEKISQDYTDDDGPQHLVAKKNGVVEKMQITKGVPLVSVNDYVTKGKRLVSGNLQDAIQNDEEKKENNEVNLVTAQGEIFARTWYDVQVTVPLTVNYEELSEQQMDKYYVSFGNKRLLVWGFEQMNFKHSLIEAEEFTLNIFNYLFPIKIVKESIYETKEYQYVRSIDEAVADGISEAKAALQLQLDQNAKILSQKVLHETTESGKVRLNLLITVSENIVEEIPITQGD